MNAKTFALAASAALAISFVAAAPSQAMVWNAVGDFQTASATSGSGLNGNGTPWSYGWSRDGGAFNAFNTFTSGSNGQACFSGLECWYQSTDVVYSVPMVAKLTGGAESYANTVYHPEGVLNLHPGMTLDGSNLDVDAIVRFTATASGSYNYKGFFEALDNNPSGVSITAGGHLVPISGAANLGLMITGTPTAFDYTTYLTGGQSIDFRVNRAGQIWNDSTGLSLNIASVPEPASWALMILGFGATGAMLRSRRRPALAAA